MKNILLISALIISTNVMAGNEKAYNKAMTSAIEQLNSSQAPEAFDAVSNKFIRIGDAEKDKWLPYYYASLAYVWRSFRIKDVSEKDKNLTESMTLLEKAKAIENNNSEIKALEGFLYMIQISIDPATRGQTHSPKSLSALGQAIEIEPSNPRALLFKGQMQFGMAQFFGSGQEEACALILKSVDLFKNGKNEDSLMPTWGLSSANRHIEKCKPSENTED